MKHDNFGRFSDFGCRSNLQTNTILQLPISITKKKLLPLNKKGETPNLFPTPIANFFEKTKNYSPINFLTKSITMPLLPAAATNTALKINTINNTRLML